MDRGIPTEDVLREMRQADPPISYLVGTPKGRLTKMEKALLARPWQAVREGVNVKLLAQEEELYVLARSSARIAKERAMRRRKRRAEEGEKEGCGTQSRRKGQQGRRRRFKPKRRNRVRARTGSLNALTGR